jgi:hypothetical protein
MASKKSTMIFFWPFFHQIQWLPNFFWKTFSPFFSKNINIIIGSIVTYCGVLPLVKIPEQFSKSPCILFYWILFPSNRIYFIMWLYTRVSSFQAKFPLSRIKPTRLSCKFQKIWLSRALMRIFIAQLSGSSRIMNTHVVFPFHWIIHQS